MVLATIGVCVPLFVISVLLLYLFGGRAEMASDLRLEQLEALHSAGHLPLLLPDRLYRTHDPFLDAGGHAAELYPNRSCQGRRRAHGHPQARLAQRRFAGRHLSGHAYRQPADRSFIVERLFAIPGLGKYFVDSITAAITISSWALRFSSAYLS